jgi:hypothetical protein
LASVTGRSPGTLTYLANMSGGVIQQRRRVRPYSNERRRRNLAEATAGAANALE